MSAFPLRCSLQGLQHFPSLPLTLSSALMVVTVPTPHPSPHCEMSSALSSPPLLVYLLEPIKIQYLFTSVKDKQKSPGTTLGESPGIC